MHMDNTQSIPPDFWSRRHNAQTENFSFRAMGLPVNITANQAQVLAAARYSAQRFSQAEPQPEAGPIRLQICVAAQAVKPIPPDLPERLHYAGVGHWITLSAGPWGHAFANLQQREALLFLSPELAAETRLVSRYFIDHYVLNFILTQWAMLHASCVCSPDGKQLLMMVAPHNSGKSTTALHLLRAGYTFLADGMALLRQTEQGFLVGGYPVGEVKLRDDVLSMFPEYGGQQVQVREQRKTVVDLRQLHRCQLAEDIIRPTRLHLLFVERHAGTQTQIEPLTRSDVWPLLVENTVFWAEAARLAHNHTTLQNMVEVARLHHLHLGSDPAGIMTALNRLTDYA